MSAKQNSWRLYALVVLSGFPAMFVAHALRLLLFGVSDVIGLKLPTMLGYAVTYPVLASLWLRHRPIAWPAVSALVCLVPTVYFLGIWIEESASATGMEQVLGMLVTAGLTFLAGWVASTLNRKRAAPGSAA